MLNCGTEEFVYKSLLGFVAFFVAAWVEILNFCFHLC